MEKRSILEKENRNYAIVCFEMEIHLIDPLNPPGSWFCLDNCSASSTVVSIQSAVDSESKQTYGWNFLWFRMTIRFGLKKIILEKCHQIIKVRYHTIPKIYMYLPNNNILQLSRIFKGKYLYVGSSISHKRNIGLSLGSLLSC